jgi:signal peptidase I
MTQPNTPQPATDNMAKRKDKGSGFVELVKTIVYAVLIALGIRTVVAEPFNIPSGSMIPTLLVGDFLFVSKFSYGYSRHSLPFSLPLWEGRIFGRLPDRGDVVVFKLPSDNRTDYIKRVVGLPGDRVQVQGGVLQINGAAVRRQAAGSVVDSDFGGRLEVRRYVETLPEGRRHAIAERSDTDFNDNTREFLVPPGHVFVMGDNRDNSSDSRVMGPGGVGFVPVVNLVGRAEFLFFSIDETARLLQPWTWPFAIRWGRLLDAIDSDFR